MTPEQLITQRLEQLEAVMREYQLWQSTPPAVEALESREPFCVDTLEPLQWLQWVLIPRIFTFPPFVLLIVRLRRDTVIGRSPRRKP